MSFSVFDDDGIHHADAAGVIIHLVHQRERRGLVRDRQIYPDEVLRRQQAQRVAQFFRADVQPRVAGGDAAVLERGIVHRRRGGMDDGIAKDG